MVKQFKDMEEQVRIAHYEHDGLVADVYLTTIEMSDDIRKMILVKTMGQTYELELAGGFRKLDEFLNGLKDSVMYHDLAGGPEDVTRFIDEHIVSFIEFLEEDVPVYVI